jgi:hypothetical protein
MDVNLYEDISIIENVNLVLDPINVIANDDISINLSASLYLDSLSFLKYDSIILDENFSGLAGQFINVYEPISVVENFDFDENRVIHSEESISITEFSSLCPTTLNIDVSDSVYLVEQIFPWKYEIKPYGVRLTDKTNLKLILTPDVGTVVSAGRIAMPAGLNADGTYGVDIDLPGTDPIPASKISVLVIPTRPVIHAISSQYISGATFYYNTMYADSGSAYYSRNDSTGVMTSWAAGARTAGDKTTWNPILAVSPVAFWDKMGQTEFTKVRLFAGAAYMLRQPYADINWSLTGTATGSGSCYPTGGMQGIPTYSNDNDLNTQYGNYFWVDWFQGSETYGNMNLECQITFSSRTIYEAEVISSFLLECQGGSAGGTMNIYLYYNSAWNLLYTLSYGNYSNVWERTDSVSGAWGGVTGIKVTAENHGRKSSGYTYAYGEHRFHEIRAWGEPDTEPKNILRYGIGSAVIPSVDYVVSIKEWDF